jgi:ribonuclease T1
MAAALFAGVVPSAGARGFRATLGTIRTAELPPEGRTVLAAIHAGGPFVSKRDGITFANREGILPREQRGYYAEYTVPTPGARTRGARRIIAGRGTTGDVRNSGEYYYTDDHYESFRRILQ